MAIRHGRSRIKLLPLMIGGVLVIGFACISAMVESEPLSSREILEKETWGEEELVDALCRQGIQPKARGSHQEVLSHLRVQIRKLPEARRREVVQKSVLRSVDEIKRQWESLEPTMRENLVKTMLTQAKKVRTRIKKLPADKKQKLKERVTSDEGKAFMTTLRQKAVNNLTPELRRELAPVVKEWIDTLEEL